MRKLLLVLFLAPLFFVASAQTPDSLKPKKTHYKYIGIQANLLLQQFISFNSNSSINTNPYLFTYNKNNIQTGEGFAFGTGFNISENSTNDGVSSITVQNINATFRFGYEKKYYQEQKLIPFWGIDFGFGGVYQGITSQLNQSFTNNTVTVETTKVFIGPDFRGGLLFAMTKRVLLGTEFFFNLQAAYTETNNGNGGFSSSFVPFNIGFQVPTALFLILRY